MLHFFYTSLLLKYNSQIHFVNSFARKEVGGRSPIWDMELRDLEFPEDRIDPFPNRIRHWFGLMVRQYLAQIVVDSLDQVLVRPDARTLGECGSEITAVPVIVSAVLRSVLVSEIVASQPHRPSDIQCKMIIVDRHALPQTTELSRKVVAKQQ